MKKVFLFFAVCMLVSTSAVFSQMTNAEIQQMISRSKDVNRYYNGINDPNLIYPGQPVTFVFEDGQDVTLKAYDGECQWSIIADKLANIGNTDGDCVEQDSNYYNPATNLPQPKSENKIFDFLRSLPWWAWIIIIFFIFYVALVISLISFKEKKKRKKAEWKLDPITSGQPFAEKGVLDMEAHNRMAEVIQYQYPGATFTIKNILRGRMNGQVNVWYLGELQPQERILNDIVGYEGTSIINNKGELVYFLQGCGNPVKEGNFFTAGAGFTFTPDVVIEEDGSESQLPAKKEMEESKITEEEKPAVVNLGSESFKTRMKILEILKEVVSTNEVHGFNVDLNSEGGIKIDVKYKFNATPIVTDKKIKKPAEEKKEDQAK